MVRVKSRYLLCEVIVEDRSRLLLLNDQAVKLAVRAAVERLHGDYGAALCSLRFNVTYLNAHTGIVFLRFPKRCYKLLWSVLPFINFIETRGQKIPCFFNCLHVGGTIRTCQKFLIKFHAKELRRMLSKCKDEKEKQEVREALQSCTLARHHKEESEEEYFSEEDS